MRKEVAVGEVAYTLKGKAFEVVLTEGCDVCARARKDWSNIACNSDDRKDGNYVSLKHRPDLDRTSHPIGGIRNAQR